MKNPAFGGKEPTVLVLGGAGFIGRHAVAALLQRHCRIVIGSRHPMRIDARLPAGAVRCPRRTARLETLQEPGDWQPLLEGVDVVVNCVGILRQRPGETYERVHHRAPGALAIACAQRRIRLVHVSAIALRDDSASRFQRSKLAGERAIRAAGGDWHLVRPSLLDGDGGFGARWLRALARLPIHALPADATGRIAALHVEDLGEALARLALAPPTAPGDPREHELGGSEAMPLADLLARLRDPHLPPARRIGVPPWLARFASHACDALHLSPFSFAHWEMLQRDNIPAPNRARAILGREPRAVGPARSSSTAPSTSNGPRTGIAGGVVTYTTAHALPPRVRTALAFAAALAVPTAALLLAISAMLLPYDHVLPASEIVMATALLFAVVAASALPVGLPAYWVLRRYSHITRARAFAAGIACGGVQLVPIYVGWIASGSGDDRGFVLFASGLAFALGAIGGLSFWYVWEPNAPLLNRPRAARGTAFPRPAP